MYDCDLALLRAQNGYVIESQGKAPDFVLEVASPTTGRADYTDKRADYERRSWCSPPLGSKRQYCPTPKHS